MSFHKKSKKGIFGVICIVLVAVLLVGALGFITKGFKDWNAKEWFGKETEEVEEEEEVEEAGINISALNVTAENYNMTVTNDVLLSSKDGVLLAKINVSADYGIGVYCCANNLDLDSSILTMGINSYVGSYQDVMQNYANKFRPVNSFYIEELNQINGFVEIPVFFNSDYISYPEFEITNNSVFVIKFISSGSTYYVSNFVSNIFSCVVLLNANGGVVESTTYTVVENDFFYPPIPEYYGYRFLGWFYENGELYNPENPVMASFILTAEWESIIYIVQFNSNGGSQIDDVFIQQGDILILPIPIKHGYDFKGWKLNNEFYNEGPIESNLILVAEWDIAILTVTFNANGGSEIASIQVAYGNIFQLPAEPERIGYNFKGWKLNGVLYSETPVISNITLTASWEIIKFTVKFYIDDELYKTILVDYGTTLYDLRFKASEFYLNIKSVSLENSEDLETEFIVSDNVLIIAEKQSGTQSIVTTLTERWYLVVGGVIILALVAALIFGKKSKKNKG